MAVANKKGNVFQIYVVDTETTGLTKENEIIEISLYRINDDSQKTFFIKPENIEAIQHEALRINKHKLEDITHQTQEGRDRYKPAQEAMVAIENWMAEDMETAENKVLCGQNITFDLGFMKNMWEKNNAYDTFPFGKRPLIIDTMQIALFLDIVKNERTEYYNLGTLVQKYGVKKEKFHAAASDTRMTKDLFINQVKIVRDLLNK